MIKSDEKKEVGIGLYISELLKKQKVSYAYTYKLSVVWLNHKYQVLLLKSHHGKFRIYFRFLSKQRGSDKIYLIEISWLLWESVNKLYSLVSFSKKEKKSVR